MRGLGYQVVSYSHMRNHELRRAKLLRDLGITVVVDGGANRGQYGSRLREHGYAGRIASFEPLAGPFAELSSRAARDGQWQCFKIALGDSAGVLPVNVAEFDQVSSMLAATGAMRTESWRPREQQETPVVTLASVLPEILVPGDRPFLKLDVQGYEYRALRGAGSDLHGFHGIELELETVALYREAMLAPKMINMLDDLGFSLFSMEPSFVDFATGRVIEFEALFLRDGDMADRGRDLPNQAMTGRASR